MIRQKVRRIGIGIGLVLLLGLSLTLFFYYRNRGLGEEEAKQIAAAYLPAEARFVVSTDQGDRFELVYFDAATGRSYQAEIGKAEAKLESLLVQAVMGTEASSIKIESQAIKSILEAELPGAVLDRYQFVEGSREGLGSIRLDFEWFGYRGRMLLNPETGDLLSYTLREAAQLVIPVNPLEESAAFLTIDEARDRAEALIGPVRIVDMELVERDGGFVYLINATDDKSLHTLTLDAKTGEQLELRSVDQDEFLALPDDAPTTKTPTVTKAATPTVTATPTPEPVTTEAPKPTVTEAPVEPPKLVIPIPTDDDDWDKIVKYAPEISREEAVRIALTRVPGATVSHVEDTDLDEEGGRIVWEIEIEYLDVDYDVIIDAYSGEVISIEVDD